jgi:hypothetical protein
MMGGKTYAAGGGMMGETPKEVRLRQSYDYRFGKDFASKLTNEQLSSISKHYNSLPKEMSSAIESRRMQGYPDELKDMAERMIKGQKPKSFVEMSRAAAGLTDLEKNLRLDEKISLNSKYGDDLPKLNKPKPRISTIPTNKMLPAAGQSSANMMKAVRAPIPASRAIVPYSGGGALARQSGGALARTPLQRINTNMNVPGGFSAAGLVKGAKTLGVELLLQYFLDKGMNYLNAKRISGIVDKASKAPAEKRDAYIESIRKDLDKEKRHQKSLGGIFDKIIEMGGETGSEYRSKNHEALLSALGSKPYEGGAIKGGFGLKDQFLRSVTFCDLFP